MRELLAVTLLIAVASPSTLYAQKRQSQEHQKSSSPSLDQGASINVTVSQPPSEPQKEAAKGKPQNGYEWFWPPVWSNWALVIVAIVTAKYAIRNLRAIESQVDEMRKTGKQTDSLIRENIAQSTSMAESVKEATRSAAAMEGVAKSLETTATASQQAASTSQQMTESMRQQMRAWVTVDIAGGAVQDRPNNIRFAVVPSILNTGLTPAINLRHRIKAAILPVPIPPNFDFSLSDEFWAGCLGPRQYAPRVVAVVDNHVPDAEVEAIKHGLEYGLYCWGVIIYEDVFGKTSHKTEFCQQLTWLPTGDTYVNYIPGHSDVT